MSSKKGLYTQIPEPIAYRYIRKIRAGWEDAQEGDLEGLRYELEQITADLMRRIENDSVVVLLKEEEEEEKCVFQFVCDKQWDDLEHTDQKSKRYCGDCARHVYLCNTEKQLERCQARRDCVCYQPDQETYRRIGLVDYS